MAMAKTRRRNEKNDYSSIASASSQAVIETTVISSPETCHEDSPTGQDLTNEKAREDVAVSNNKNDNALVIDIEEAIDRLGMGIFQIQILAVELLV